MPESRVTTASRPARTRASSDPATPAPRGSRSRVAHLIGPARRVYGQMIDALRRAADVLATHVEVPVALPAGRITEVRPGNFAALPNTKFQFVRLAARARVHRLGMVDDRPL